MRVLFIYPDISTDIMNFSPAIQVLSAVLKLDGHQTFMLHINNNGGIKYDSKVIIEQSAGYDLFAITSTSFNYRYANEIAGWLKQAYPNVLRVLGGSHATIQPEDFELSNFDIFCVGEGEEPMWELCHAVEHGEDWTGILNLITRAGHNPVRGFLKNLDALPFWDFDVIDTVKILKKRHGWLSIAFSRGCPYECTFCINHLYKKIEVSKQDKLSDYLRRRTPANAINELESLVKRFPVKFFNIDDDLLTMNKRWMQEFTTLYTERIYKPYDIRYVVNARADTLTEDVVQMLADSGCKEARIGFETGNEQLRNVLLQKKTSNVDLERAFTILDKYKVMGVAFAMMGVPGESYTTFQDTVRMIIRLKPRLIRMTFLFPYKHTRIYDICVERGLFKDDYIIENNRDFSSPLKFEGLTDKDLFCMRFLFPWYVNMSMLGNSVMGHAYWEAINYFKHFSLDALRGLLSIIIERDVFLSSQCQEAHYRYYSGNEYYFELYDNI